jgi:hypothetical protein
MTVLKRLEDWHALSKSLEAKRRDASTARASRTDEERRHSVELARASGEVKAAGFDMRRDCPRKVERDERVVASEISIVVLEDLIEFPPACRLDPAKRILGKDFGGIKYEFQVAEAFLESKSQLIASSRTAKVCFVVAPHTETLERLVGFSVAPEAEELGERRFSHPTAEGRRVSRFGEHGRPVAERDADVRSLSKPDPKLVNVGDVLP